MTTHLQVTLGGRTVSLEPRPGRRSVGRDADADLLVVHDLVSRWHASLEYDGGWVVQDGGSTNGTWHGGRRVTSMRISGPVRLRLGDPDTGPVLELVPAAVGPGVTHGRVVVGRDPSCDVVLDDPMASRRHAEVVVAPDGAWITDLGSTNTTLLEGVPVTRARLSPGDRVIVGGTTLTFDGATLRASAVTRFVVDRATLALPSGKRIVDEVSFRIDEPSLLAVIGPSGAGKSSLLRLVTGRLEPTSGSVSLDGATMVSQRQAHRGQIGVVPQHTVAHRSLTARQALDFTARLRLPADTDPDERRAVVSQQLSDLGLAEHAETRVDRLSGGQQRRLAIAMELLTDPAVLILDEPTAGLDPSLVLQIMRLLRDLAERGKQVVVVTHDLEHLALAHAVLVLRPGGTVAYHGPPSGIFPHFGTTTWAATFDVLAAPDAAAPAAPAAPPRPAPAAPVVVLPVERRGARSTARDGLVVLLRQLRLLVADPLYLALLVVMPAALAGLALTVPGTDGFAVAADPTSTEASRLLVLLVVGAAFLGLSAVVRDLVQERDIFEHEREAGLSPGGYLGAKLGVFSVTVVLQVVVMVGIVLLLREGPERGLVAGPRVDLVVAACATALANVALGLAVSARVRTSEQTMPPLVLLVMGQLVLCGGLFPVDGRGALQLASLVVPTRWGYAAAASSVDLEATSEAVLPDDLWLHEPSRYLLCLVVLAGTWLVMVLLTGHALSRRRTRL